MKCQRCGEVNPAEIHTCTPKREWQGLTAEEQLEIMKQFGPGQRGLFADAIEAKLKEKNGG